MLEKPWIIYAPSDPGIPKIEAESRSAVLSVCRDLIVKGATSLIVVAPDNTVFGVKRRSKREPQRLTFEKVHLAPAARRAYAIYWRKRSIRSVTIDDKGRERYDWSESGPWVFHSRWENPADAVKVAIGIERDPTGTGSPVFGLSEDAPDWALEATVEPVQGGAMAKDLPMSKPRERANLPGAPDFEERMRAYRKGMKPQRERAALAVANPDLYRKR